MGSRERVGASRRSAGLGLGLDLGWGLRGGGHQPGLVSGQNDIGCQVEEGTRVALYGMAHQNLVNTNLVYLVLAACICARDVRVVQSPNQAWRILKHTIRGLDGDGCVCGSAGAH
jgi:hypothetical protein